MRNFLPILAVIGRLDLARSIRTIGADPSFGEQPKPVGWIMARGRAKAVRPVGKRCPVSLISDYRKCAQQWFELAEHLPLEDRPALEAAEAWFQLEMDAVVFDTGQKRPPAAEPHSIH